MFCPNCGANNLSEQKFCRSCGFNLEKTAESLLEQIPSATSAALLKREKLINQFGYFALSGFGVVALIGVTILIYTVIEKFLVSGTNIYLAVLIVAFVIFALLSLIFVIFNESLQENKSKINQVAPENLTGKTQSFPALEEKEFIPVITVTENSTELLFNENQTRKIK